MPTPDFAKVRAAIAKREPQLTPKALALIAAGKPVHIMPRPVRMKLPPVDAARRGKTKGLNERASRCNFQCFNIERN